MPMSRDIRISLKTSLSGTFLRGMKIHPYILYKIYGGTDVAQSHVFLFIFVCEPFTVTITQVN